MRLRQSHRQYAAAGASEGVGDIVVLRQHGLGVRHVGRCDLVRCEVCLLANYRQQQ